MKYIPWQYGSYNSCRIKPVWICMREWEKCALNETYGTPTWFMEIELTLLQATVDLVLAEITITYLLNVIYSLY